MQPAGEEGWRLQSKPAAVFWWQEEDFEDMIDLAETMENQYGHLFDRVVVNGDVTAAFRELRADLQRVDRAEVQWIPPEWLCPPATGARRSCGQLGGWICGQEPQLGVSCRKK